MSKQTKSKTTAALRGNSTNTNGATVTARLQRIRAHIEKRLADVRGLPTYLPAAWLEEIEGRPLADAILDHIRAERGYDTERPQGKAEFDRRQDEDAENFSTRARNAHEKEIAAFAVFRFLAPAANVVSSTDARELVRRFYRPGDCGLHNAIARAVKAALVA